MPKTMYQPTTAYKLIYIFCIHDQAHEGLLKVGDASLDTSMLPDMLTPNCSALNQAAKARICSYTNTAGISFHLLHTELAICSKDCEDGSSEIIAFRDNDVHSVLTNSGIEKVHPNETNANEWFRVDLETAKRAIVAVKQGRKSLYAYEVTPSNMVEIILRKEQEDAITKTIERFKHGNQMLWNAKMRYGKTITALSLVKQQLGKYKRTLIITHRPVVQSGWREDFYKVFKDDKCVFAAKDHDSDVPEESSKIDYANEMQLRQLIAADKPFIYFASIQDLRGSQRVGGRFNKNNAVFNIQWDLVINDEAHEGTQTELGKRVTSVLSSKNTKVLSLSGTPFNIMYQYDDDSMYTWDYVMEQAQKDEWDKTHPGDPNPYASLPQMHIFTYELGDIIRGFSPELEDKAFNFSEFFRTWTGDPQKDGEDVPSNKSIGDLVHEEDINKFLKLITTKSDESDYPFSTEDRRNMFRHTLWMIPGVKEAKALSKLLRSHPVFQHFGIANVAGQGDDYEESHYSDALALVRKTIRENDYSITLSCGKLTTGVTIREWTACMMLAGSYSTAASGYLQTIFRVQSPGSVNGKAKEHCYVFDFAPDRTLKIVAEAARVSRKSGSSGTKADDDHRETMRKFLNFCPVLAISGTNMKPYSVDSMMQQIKRIYAEKAMRSGFEDASIYSDKLYTLDEEAQKTLADLKAQIGKTKSMDSGNEVVVSDNGLTEEEYEAQKKLKNKPKRELTEEEKARREQLKEQANQRKNAISILRGVSVRMPLLIYGADVSFSEEISIERFVELVDETSWKEFMPKGVTKDLFRKLIRFYDKDVFVAAGKEIRRRAKHADGLLPTERVQTIAQLFSYFKNPDKETVLTPWRVVNMHMSDTLGGYDFWDAEHKETVEIPQLVDHGKVTHDTLLNPNARILEINSKTGLYPLYVTYSIYRAKCDAFLNPRGDLPPEKRELTVKKQCELWDAAVKENIFVICKTKMAKTITQRTLVGYRDVRINAHSFDDLINQLNNKPEQFVAKVSKGSYWKVEGVQNMKFDAIVGNPPYQEMDGGNGASARPVYHLFIEQAKALQPSYISMITPSRWFSGGKGLDAFRDTMLKDKSLSKVFDYVDNEMLFCGVLIVGGVNYFLWDKSYKGNCEFTSIRKNKTTTLSRNLSDYDILVRNNESVRLLQRISEHADRKMDEVVYTRNVFGISTDTKGCSKPDKTHSIKLFCSQNSNSTTVNYIKQSEITKQVELMPMYKVIIGRVVPRGGEVGVDPQKGYRAITTVQVLPPNSVFTDTYLMLAAFATLTEAENFAVYMTQKLPRFLLHETFSSLNITKDSFRFVPYLDYSKKWTDKELYDRYDCTTDEIEMIDSMIRPLEYIIH